MRQTSTKTRATRSVARARKDSPTRSALHGLDELRLISVTRRLHLSAETVRRIRVALGRGLEVPDSPVYILQNSKLRESLAETMIVETDDEAYERIAQAVSGYELRSVNVYRSCPICFAPAIDHPSEIERGFAHLRVLCDGQRLKI